MSRVTMIDMDEELEAIKNGECGFCRIGGTHKSTVECNATHQDRFDMKYCTKCENMWCKNFFKECPICNSFLSKGAKTGRIKGTKSNIIIADDVNEKH